MSFLEDSKQQAPFNRYEQQQIDLQKQVAFSIPGQPYIFDSNPHSDLHMMTNYFQDMSISTNTGPPSYDVPFTQSFLLPIPNDCVGLIIGKQGEMIKHLRLTTNASVIQVAKDCSPGCNYRNLFIEGSLESYCLAKKMIYEIIDENNRAKRLPTFNLTHYLSSEPYVEIIVPEAYIALVLGDNFDLLEHIIKESRAKVLVPTKSAPGTNNRYINISGQPESINKAKRMIYEILEPAYRKDAISNGIGVPQHELIDHEFPYCSFFGLVLKVQLITMTACEGTCNSATAALKGLTLAGHENYGHF